MGRDETHGQRRRAAGRSEWSRGGGVSPREEAVSWCAAREDRDEGREEKNERAGVAHVLPHLHSDERSRHPEERDSLFRVDTKLRGRHRGFLLPVGGG